MSKFNHPRTATIATSGPIRSETIPTGTTHEGAPGYARNAKSELFLLAVTNMVGEKTFYESAGARDSRFSQLVRTVAVDDLDWLTRFAGWLRSEANMRSVSIVLAAEAVKSGVEGTRKLVASVLQRADEPGEIVGYWHSHYGRALPKPLKRGIADAAQRLYTERALLKYDTPSHAVRFADVIRLCHVAPRGDWQSALFSYAIADRLGNDGFDVDRADLPMIHYNRMLRTWTPEVVATAARNGGLGTVLAEAGMTWEAVPSLVPGPWTKELWEAVIPSMGYMALLRNLRNFDEAKVGNKAAADVAAKLRRTAEVARSRQFPMRFLSAYNAAPSLRWAWALEQALDASLANLPTLGGRTLLMVDTSTSMDEAFSKDGSLHRWDAAAMFALALARRCADAEVVSYSSAQKYLFDQAGLHTKTWVPRGGESVLKSLERWKADGYFLGGGTETAASLRKHYRGHDRVVLLTDEQAGLHRAIEVTDAVPAHVPMFTWNLAGYERGHAPERPNRWTFGGLTDAGFKMVPLLERGRNADWPF